MANKFIHLHTHSHYSLLDGLSKIKNLVDLVKKHEMPAIGLTDHGNMYGSIDFYKTCKSAGIKPIIGVEVYVAERTRFDKESGIDNKRYHLTLLAKNVLGYKNLIKIVTKSNLEGFYYKPRVDHDLLRENSEGIICLSGCPGGELSKALKSKDKEKAKKIISEYQNIFGKENYFLEIMNHDMSDDKGRTRQEIINLGKELNIPIVGTQDSHYLHPEDKKAHETLLAIQTSSDINDDNKFTFGDDDFSFIDTKTAEEQFKDIPEAVTNTQKIADMCDIELDLGKWVFPNFPIEKEENYDEKLKRLTYEGIEERRLEKTKELMGRVDYELEIIKNKGYSPYFLVVSDLLNFARENNIVSTTRGSAAGSIVSFLTHITTVNPIEYNLPFERFLNPDRPSPPDIDMDIADDKRDTMIDYVKQKYGADKVAQIGTFGTMMARGAVRDVARALGYPYETGDRISKLIPMGSQGFPMTIDHAIELVPELKDIYKKEIDAKEIMDLAKKLEGCARHISVHAAGVVISPTPLTDFVPIQFDPKGGKMITQYDMYAIEDAGLLKFDFLGIRNLAILGDSVKLVKKTHGIDIDIENVPLEDKKTFEMLARGETIGLFQLNGSGMTRYLKELKPSTIHDINAMVALYRPGPMATIDEYIARKHGKKPIIYYHPKMKSYLDKSYGLLVYQDDLLFTALNVAGYNWKTVDKFRKAVGKKIPEEMAKQHKIFVEGCEKYSGMTKKEAEKIWDLFEPFQGYGFNKAHAASYGKVAYQTAYMKANFPLEYMCAILTAESGDVDKIAEIIAECKNMEIPVLPPNINESYGGFTVIYKGDSKKEGDIRFGLYTIKNLGTDISDAIIEERKRGGKFESIGDFVNRIKHKNLNKKSLEALIKCGAMDALGERGKLMFNVEDLLSYNRELSKMDKNQTSLFGAVEISSAPMFNLKESDPATKEEKLLWEKDLLGLYISGHPLDRVKDKIKEKGIDIKKIKEEIRSETSVVFAGIITDARIVNTKKNDRMAFIKIADFSDNIEAVVFPRTFTELSNILVIDKCVAIKGKVSFKNGEKSIIIEGAKEI
ncbi:MAG: DNA polymerase III subunit alpha [Candidatus Paceibacterota bacterium]|jgi:DNA polymerase-3 subunit alpha